MEGVAGLSDRPRIGASRLTQGQQATLRALILAVSTPSARRVELDAGGHRDADGDQRHTFVYAFAAVEPATGRDFCLVLPEVSTAAMNAFPRRFAATSMPSWCSTVRARTPA